MKVFVTGVCGQLGHDVVNELLSRGHEAIGSDIQPQYAGIQDGSAVVSAPYVSMDITDEKNVLQVIEELKPDAVVHCAAWTNVDGAEDPENKELVYRINTVGTKNIAMAVKNVNGKMLYLSTDYVFDGKGKEPWKADENRYAPLNEYGKSKLGGELAVKEVLEKFYIVRIAWAFGLNGKNFIKTMINIGMKNSSVKVVRDQIGTPTYTLDLSRLLVDMIETDRYGIYHATNEGGYISWADFAKEIYKQAGMDTVVVPVRTSEYGLSKALRPYNSRLDKTKLVENGFRLLPTWQDALARFLKEYDSGYTRR